MVTSVFSLHLKVFDSLAFIDIIPQSKHSSLVFFIGMIGCYKGFNAENGKQVGQAANSA
jgi:phospholipid/cholesterol/gamma-HCH transport system permease protein